MRLWLVLALLGAAAAPGAALAQPHMGTGNPVNTRGAVPEPVVAPAPAPAAAGPGQADDMVGRITDIEVNHGYAVAEFPGGRMNVSMDKRELGQYKVGDLLRIDSFGRPQPRSTTR